MRLFELLILLRLVISLLATNETRCTTNKIYTLGKRAAYQYEDLSENRNSLHVNKNLIDEEIWSTREDSFTSSTIPLDLLRQIFEITPYSTYRAVMMVSKLSYVLMRRQILEKIEDCTLSQKDIEMMRQIFGCSFWEGGAPLLLLRSLFDLDKGLLKLPPARLYRVEKMARSIHDPFSHRRAIYELFIGNVPGLQCFRLLKVLEKDREACALVKASQTFRSASHATDVTAPAIAIGIFVHTALAYFAIFGHSFKNFMILGFAPLAALAAFLVTMLLKIRESLNA